MFGKLVSDPIGTIGDIFGGGGCSGGGGGTGLDAFVKEMRRYREQNADLQKKLNEIQAELKDKKIDSFEALSKQDEKLKKALIKLAQKAKPVAMIGINIGLFGITSTGKSTMLNSLLGKKVAETGVGETITTITPYQGTQYTLWDVPGKNDEINYLSLEYIAFFKGLSRRLVLIQATVKENTSMLRLLDEIELRYDVVFNKFDKVDEEERAPVQKQIRSEIQSLGLKGVDHVFFVSSKHMQMFPDWLAMVNLLSSP